MKASRTRWTRGNKLAEKIIVSRMKRNLKNNAPFLISLDFHDGDGFMLFGAEVTEEDARRMIAPLEAKGLCVGIIDEPNEVLVYKTVCRQG